MSAFDGGNPALVIFAKDAPRLAEFYRRVLRLNVAAEDAHHVLLRGDDVELVIHALPPEHAVEVRVTQPPRVREDAAIKPAFLVDDLEATRAEASLYGGHLKPREMTWRWRGCLVLDGWDPEGNVVQFRQVEAGQR